MTDIAERTCRLCINITQEYYDVFSEKMKRNELKEKISKYLYLEILEEDAISKAICFKCVSRIDEIHTYWVTVMANQDVFRISQHLVENADEPTIVDFNQYSIKNDSYIVTLVPSTDGYPANPSIVSNQFSENIIPDSSVPASGTISPCTKQQVQQTQTVESENRATTAVSHHLDEPPPDTIQNDQTIESHDSLHEPDDDDSDSSEYFNDDDIVFDLEDAPEETKPPEIVLDVNGSEVYGVDDQFAGFPKMLIQDSKLLVRGNVLLNLISRFYSLECDLCADSKQIYSRLSALCAHYKTAHSMKGYIVCCGNKLVKARAMAMHMARHLQPSAFQCTLCDKMMTCPKILQYHLQNHLPEDQRPLACPRCPRRFSYSSALIAHSISHKPLDEREAHVCDECGKSFSAPGRLSTHINVAHIQQPLDFICHICAKQFSCRSNLGYHLTTHQPRAVHEVKCEQCGKWLKNKLCLRKHMAQHSEIRYSCDRCDYTAVNRQCLRNHNRTQHSDVKPFSCQYCGNSFKLRNTLRNHMVQHTGVRKFVCEFCSRTFASSGNYYSHRKRMHPHELAAVNKKKEDDEQRFRAKALDAAGQAVDRQ